MLSISFYLGNSLTKVALAGHLKILNIATHHSIKKLASPFTLMSKYDSRKTSFKIQYVCREKQCKQLLVCGGDGHPTLLQNCGHKHIRNNSHCCFILQLPIEQQLLYFMEHHGLPELLQQVDPNIRSDVNSGTMYRKLVESGVINSFIITLQVNADGASCYRKSKYSFWPLMALINDVPYKLRRSYIILLALWFGNKKPPRDAFLGESITELRRLENDGFLFKGILYKIRVLVVTTDTVARPLLLNTSQFNGECGCNFCLHPGERVSKGKGGTRVYPEPNPDDEDPTNYPLRSKDQHLLDLEFVLRTGKPRNGIMGPTPLMNLLDLDFVKAFVPEYMHAVCQGVFKQYTGLLTSTKDGNGKKPWFVGIRRSSNKMKVINMKLSQAKVPYEITRIVESFDDFSDYKASMFRTFFLYLFPVLENVLPQVYFRHVCNLSYAIYALLQEQISVEDVIKVGVLLKYVVLDFESLYGKKNVGINVHFLTHLSQSVIDWGCLWSTSTFIPESFNGELLTLCKGTQNLIKQMASNYMLKSVLRDEVLQLLKNNKVPSPVHSLFTELLHLPHSRELWKGNIVSNGKIKLLGRASPRSITIEEEVAIRNYMTKNIGLRPFLDVDFVQKNIKSYPRLQILKSHSIFTTTSYKRSSRRINYFAFLMDNNFFSIESIWHLQTKSISVAIIVGRIVGLVSKETYLPEPINGTVFSPIPGQTTKLVGLSPIIAYEPTIIKSKCVTAMNNTLTDTFILTALPNNFETD